MRNPQLGRDRRDSFRTVAGEDRDLEPRRAQGCNRLSGFRTQALPQRKHGPVGAMAIGDEGGAGVLRLDRSGLRFGITEPEAAEPLLILARASREALAALFTDIGFRGSDAERSRQCLRQRVMTGSGKRADLGPALGRERVGIEDVGLGQGQRSRLVEDGDIGLGKALQRVALLQHDLALEQGGGRDDLHGGYREAERTGAGDDQHGDGNHQGLGPGESPGEPAEEGRRRQRVDHRRIEPRSAVRQADIARAAADGLAHQAVDLVEQRALPGRLDADGQRAR